MNYYIGVIKNYALFSGRARRKEYWMFVLFNIIFGTVAQIADHIFGTTVKINGLAMTYGYIYIAYSLFTLIPNIAVSIRRLHDVGKSGWLILVSIIPSLIFVIWMLFVARDGWLGLLGLITLTCVIWVLVLLCTDGVPGVNKYGPNPKGIAMDQFDFMNNTLN